MSEPRKRKNLSDKTRPKASKPKQRHSSKQSKKPTPQSTAKAPLRTDREPSKKIKQKNTPSSKKNVDTSSALWTMNNSKVGKKNAKESTRSASGAVTSFFGLIGRGIVALFAGIFRLIGRSKITTVVAIALVLVLALTGADTAMNWGKVYPGVKVGSLDLSGYTIEEAEGIISDTYEQRLTDKYVYIFANEEVSQNMNEALEGLNNHELAEQQSVQEAAENRKLWITDAALLEARVDARSIAQAAVNVGRDDGGLFKRLEAMFVEYTIKPWANYESKKFEELATKIDASIGDPRVNYGVVVQEGIAAVTEGHDGYMVDRDDFAKQLDDAFLDSEGESGSFIAYAEYAPLQITQDEANRASEQVNKVLDTELLFTFNNATWQPTRSEAGNWVATEIKAVSDGEFQLIPSFDSVQAKGMIMNHLTNFDGSTLQVTFEMKDREPVVHAKTEAQIPVVADAIDKLNDDLFFDKENASDTLEHTAQGVTVHLSGTNVPPMLSFDEALENGIIAPITSFTTEYSSYAEARNHNIHLVSSKLSNSIAAANGGTWSFNDVAGECNEAAGFMAAGAIYDGEFVQEYGGGICQVATTVFNAVYDAGFPVPQRQAHSLYMASYPAGRDAAVSWPDLDLVWQNDSSSDVLLKMTCTETSVTAILYGVSPEYQVSTTTGEWQEGQKYKTKTTVDDALAPGYEYVKTNGIDGKSITIVRTVKDSAGNILHEDTFWSGYNAQDEEKVTGPKKQEEPSSTNDGSTESDDTSERAANNEEG